jgi:hypothetical protein
MEFRLNSTGSARVNTSFFSKNIDHRQAQAESLRSLIAVKLKSGFSIEKPL